MAGKYIEYLPGEKHPAKNAATSDFIEAFTDCGQLLEDNEVVIDIDDIGHDQIRAMIDSLGIVTECVWTNRGAHLYYRMPPGGLTARAHVCALGFKVEMKTAKNSPRGITRKQNGKERRAENVGVREVIPWYFSSLQKFPELVGLHEGEGRNEKIFKHVAKIGTDKDPERIAQFINNYIFADPMPETELLATVGSALNRGQSEKEEYTLAGELIDRYKCVLYEGIVWLWDGVKYVPNENGDLMDIIWDRCVGQKMKYVREIADQIESRCQKIKEDTFIVRFKNGYVDNGRFYHDKSIDVFTPFYIPIEYDPQAEPVQIVDDYINSIVSNDPDYRALLLEALAYPLITDLEKMTSYAKFFILRGDGQNGKGTFFNIMRRIYGKANCSAFSPQELKDEKNLVSCVGKLVNLGDDISPEAFNNEVMKRLKNLSSADMVGLRRLYQQGKQGQLYTKMFFSTNADIKTFEKGYAYQRRVIWLPMFNRITKKDGRFVSKITTPEALRYWVRLIVDSYQRLWDAGEFTQSAAVQEYNESYHKDNNHMNEFLELIDIDVQLIDRPVREVRELYNEIIDDPKSKPYNAKMLNEIIRPLGIEARTKHFPGVGKRKAFVRVR